MIPFEFALAGVFGHNNVFCGVLGVEHIALLLCGLLSTLFGALLTILQLFTTIVVLSFYCVEYQALMMSFPEEPMFSTVVNTTCCLKRWFWRRFYVLL